VIVVWRACPSAKLTARVVRFAAVDVGRENRTRRSLPAGIRYHALRAPALIADLELSAQAKPPAVEIALAEEAEMSPVPPIAEHRTDGVGAGPEQRRDVVGLVLQPAAVRCPAGCEELVADALSVEIDLVEAEGGDVETGGAHAVGNAERATQEWRWRWEAI
jgi:hypothetical protein